MPVVTKFLVTVGLIVASTAVGYLARRRGWVPERAAQWLMTGVVVFGYSPVSFCSIWSIDPKPADVWLPVLGTVQIVLLAVFGMLAGRLLGREKADSGLLGMAGAVGNTGFTMGGFVIYLLFGVEGLGRGSIYGLMWYPMMVLLLYPIGRYFSGSHKGSLLRLMLKSIFDWRSIGLPVTLVGLLLALFHVPRPKAIEDYHVVPIVMYIVLPTAYFSIGLRLHFSSIASLKKFIAVLTGFRFALGPALGLLLAYMTTLTAHPLTGVSRGVLLINSCVPTAITAVAVANMFHLKPREASVLFVVNTLTYLVIVLPVVLWIFGR